MSARRSATAARRPARTAAAKRDTGPRTGTRTTTPAAKRGVGARPTTAARRATATRRARAPGVGDTRARAAKPAAWPVRAVAALFIERQHLDRPRGQRLTAESLARFATDTGGLQMDSINVVDRAHYITAWSRFGPYDRAAFDRLVYGERVLFEYFAHMACLVPAGHLAWWRRVMHKYASERTRWAPWLKKNSHHVRAVEDAIRERGPLANADFKQARPAGRSGWWNWKPAAYALNYLWIAGRIAVHSRVHFQKRYDLFERVWPSAPEIEPPAAEEFHRWHVRRSLHAMGAATDLDLRLYLSYPRLTQAERRQAVESLLRSGEVTEIAVEGGSERWLILTEDLAALEAAGRKRAAASGSTLLSPFDSLLWHRERTKRLFGYHYRIEVYTPGHKRVHGYYSLPIYQDGHLVGRLDAKAHREERRLEVRSVHFEPWLAKGSPPPASGGAAIEPEAALDGLTDSLASLATFVGAARTTLGRVAPARLRAPLARAMRSVRPAPRPKGSKRRADGPAKADVAEPNGVDEETPV